jgi:thiol-disulfide isomerase/thioredoxin
LLYFGLSAGAVAQEQSYGEPPLPKVVAYVIAELQQGDLASANAMVQQYRRLNGDTPQALDALSWLARGELAAGHIDQANKYADDIENSSRAALATRKLDAEPYLPIALGAAYEVQAQALVGQQKRAEAIQLLQTALHTWRGTSIVGRLQKNINLLTLEGKPMPPLQETEWIGKKPASIAALHGRVVLLFFWAHWCADCKADSPVIAKVATDLAPKGLVVLTPTRRYGYTAQEEHAGPGLETPFIEKVYAKYYSEIPSAGVPLSTANFERFGVSTTPTIVLVDRRGIIRLYHPGLMSEAELRQAIDPLLTK